MKNLKIFFAAFFISLPFWLGVNFFQENLEDFLFWRVMAANPQLLMAQMVEEENLAALKPIRNRSVYELAIGAEAAISVFVDNDGSERILFEKNSAKPLPIASLTKLMTAKIVLEYYDIKEQEVAHLLYPLLISSDNKSADILAGMFDEAAFVDLMNLEAKNLGLENTYFFNPTGLDPKEPESGVNYSTADDLVKFAGYLTLAHPLIWEISAIEAFENSVSTNELLEDFPDIIGGKTGETPRAGGCLILIVKAPKGKGYIVSVVLNSQNRFEEMRQLINWSEHAYKW